jgi:hypothetical protein
MSAFRADFDWQMQFLPSIKAIVGPLLLRPAPLELDVAEATDMLVLHARDMRIACRVRRPGYADRYPWQFTLRSRRDNGIKTELQKVVEGWGDWLFYGHAAAVDEQELARWFLIDLGSWRAHMILRVSRRLIGSGELPNGDGTHFVWFDLTSFPPDPPILIAASHQLPRGVAA